MKAASAFQTAGPSVCICSYLLSVNQTTREINRCSPHSIRSICSPHRSFQRVRSQPECHRALPGSHSSPIAKQRGSGARGQCLQVTDTCPTFFGHLGNPWIVKERNKAIRRWYGLAKMWSIVADRTTMIVMCDQNSASFSNVKNNSHYNFSTACLEQSFV